MDLQNHLFRRIHYYKLLRSEVAGQGSGADMIFFSKHVTFILSQFFKENFTILLYWVLLSAMKGNAI